MQDLKARVELTALQNERELGLLIVATAFSAFALRIGKDAIVVDALKVVAITMPPTSPPAVF